MHGCDALLSSGTRSSGRSFWQLPHWLLEMKHQASKQRHSPSLPADPEAFQRRAMRLHVCARPLHANEDASARRSIGVRLGAGRSVYRTRWCTRETDLSTSTISVSFGPPEAHRSTPVVGASERSQDVLVARLLQKTSAARRGAQVGRCHPRMGGWLRTARVLRGRARGCRAHSDSPDQVHIDAHAPGQPATLELDWVGAG